MYKCNPPGPSPSTWTETANDLQCWYFLLSVPGWFYGVFFACFESSVLPVVSELLGAAAAALSAIVVFCIGPQNQPLCQISGLQSLCARPLWFGRLHVELCSRVAALFLQGDEHIIQFCSFSIVFCNNHYAISCVFFFLRFTALEPLHGCLSWFLRIISQGNTSTCVRFTQYTLRNAF